MDAAIGFDTTSNTLILFGGQANDIPQSSTYLLSLANLTWRSPSPPANLPEPLHRSPPPRSAAVFGGDSAASYRRSFVVIGGKGNNNEALSDVWAFDFGSEIWAEMDVSPGGPGPRWGASGGIDVRTPNTQDPHRPEPNSTFYLSGGVDGTQPHPLSDVWKLQVTGTLSSNNPESLLGSWERVSGLNDLPSKTGQAGTVVGSTLVAFGGCDSTSVGDPSCAEQDGYSISTIGTPSSFSFTTCPAPRIGASLTPNLNTASDTFSSQVFMIHGLFDADAWDDSGGLEQGEVAILSYATGTWRRVIPAGDPDESGKLRYPTPRRGASVYSSIAGLVGHSTSMYTDTVMYGGQDAAGNYLEDLWLLRAYNGRVASSDEEWPGYANGELQSGVDASGAGVKLQFIPDCATPGGSQLPTSSIPLPPSPSNTNVAVPSTQYTASITHKILSPISVILLFPAIFCYRLAFAAHESHPSSQLPQRHATSFYMFILFTVSSYALAITGLTMAFTSLSSSTPTTSILSRRDLGGSSRPRSLQTGHGHAALAFFALTYVITPLLAAIFAFRRFTRRRLAQARATREERRNSLILEKKNSADATTGPHSESSCGPTRAVSVGAPSIATHLGHEGRLSPDMEPTSPSPTPFSTTPRSFSVVNRPQGRARSASNGWLAARAAELSSDGGHRSSSSYQGHLRSLSDVDWMTRRRSLNAVGELDYALTLARRANEASTPGTMDHLVTHTHSSTMPLPPAPPISEVLLKITFHVSFIGLCAVVLAALWTHDLQGAFGAFLAVTVLSYLMLAYHARKKRPSNSLTSYFILHMQRPRDETPQHPNTPLPPTEDHYPFPTEEQRSPYSWHQPAYRAATSTEHEETIYHHNDNADDDIEDEDVRQRIIEEEMNRRDVSIVTVPKRKLWIANPEMHQHTEH